MLPLQISLTLPPWIGDVADVNRRYATDEERMSVALALARGNVDRGDGGPFGAALFNNHSGRLVAVGVNRVVPQHCSLAHAENMALMIAQQRLGRHRINADGGHYALATSAQPCCQCYGAIMWAGIDTLLIGARTEDVESLTAFDEGPLPADWVGELQRRGITARRDILRDASRDILADYGRNGPSY